MLTHKLFNVGQTVYSLLNSSSNPNVNMLIRCEILDIKFDEINPKYKVVIKEFYDDYNFVSRYIFTDNLYHEFDRRPRVSKFNMPYVGGKIHNMDDLMELIEKSNPEDFALLVDSVNTVETKDEMYAMNNAIQTIFIYDLIREALWMSNRTNYNGEFRINNIDVARKTLESLFPKCDIETINNIV